MATDKKPTSSENNSVSIHGDVRDSTVIIGDNNLFQKIINYIFPSEKETLEQRNRRILLNHVENAWIKGVLDASLHGAALLDLGIKQDPEAVTQYPWTLKKESTDETLPTGTSMLEIFDSIGMGRSLLILGAPGSGKTTMLLELARGLIARAREDITQPIPMVFNLASWTEKLSLADWLAQELNNLYSVPRKTAPDWVKGNKLLLLLDGLDEVRQESRAKCVEAINEFRNQNGLTSLAVCSRSQDYADLKAKLSFEGAIKVQPLKQEQIAEFFKRFGDEMVGIKQALEKDSNLQEMAQSPLFLSIILMVYRDKRDLEILISENKKVGRKYLFDAYVKNMFERLSSRNVLFKKPNVLHWLSWLANKTKENNQELFFIENIQPRWLGRNRYLRDYGRLVGLINSVFGVIGGAIIGWLFGFMLGGLYGGNLIGIIGGIIGGGVEGFWNRLDDWLNENIRTVDSLTWKWVGIKRFIYAILIIGLPTPIPVNAEISEIVRNVLIAGFFSIVLLLMGMGLGSKKVYSTNHPGEKLSLSTKNFLVVILSFGFIFGVAVWVDFILLVDPLKLESADLVNNWRLFWILVHIQGIIGGLFLGSLFGLFIGLGYGGNTIIHHYCLRIVADNNNLLPWRLVPFLDHCVDLIFLRRVGGGYIFVHRLLMEHFAEMYVEAPTSKGN